MLDIKDKPKIKAAKEVQFTKSTHIQKIGVEMLITLNTTNREFLTGPDVGLDLCILITKIKPYFFFNPSYITPKSLNIPNDDSIIEVRYQNYLGNEKKLVIKDVDKTLRTAIDHLVKGKPRKKRAKNNANKSRN